jgi:hypothetical protein
MKLLSVNVGLPRDIEWKGKVVRTSIFKARELLVHANTGCDGLVVALSNALQRIRRNCFAGGVTMRDLCKLLLL